MRALLALLVLAAPLVAAPVPKGVKKVNASPDGVWYLVEFSSDGEEPAPRPENMTADWVIEGEYIHVGTKVEPAHHAKGAPNFPLRDPDRPNLRMWGKNPAVYEVDGDTLRACYAHDGRTELTECKPGQGIHYYVFTRAKAER